jgi:lysophospholipase L1-like esterase
MRIESINPSINGQVHNDARSSAKAVDLPAQAQAAVGQRVQYVTVLVGANDVCARTESGMTSTATFSAQVEQTLTILSSGLPNAQVLVSSIPDLNRLWEVGRKSVLARSVWSVGGICQAMLKNPRSNADSDNARRGRVRQRVMDYNAVLQTACRRHANCRYDNGAVFSYRFTLNELSKWDYFHPNEAGQSALARVTWASGFAW